MTQNNISLLSCFIAERAKLIRFLTRRTGCAATAEDLLQEAWIRLSRLPTTDFIDSPSAYLRRMASNLAIDHARACERRPLNAVEVEDLLSLADEAPDTERAVSDAQQLQHLLAIVGELPERRRALFIAARIEGVAQRELAERFGISLRTVELELHRALNHCAARLGRTPTDC
jgi:RNA polymerase sigma-70 factor (ECF subfamily)